MVPTCPKPLARPEKAPNFIYITGSDGTGKTTQAHLLLEYLKNSGVNVQHLWLRFPFFFSLPLLAYARMRGYSYYEEKDGYRQGYWEFYRSRILRTLFAWVLLLDAAIATFRKVTLPLLAGKTIVCERFILDMVADLSLAFKDPDFQHKLPGRLFFKLIPANSEVFILDIDLKTLRTRRADLQIDRKLRRRLEIFRQLAADHVLQVLSSKSSIESIQAEIRSRLPEPQAFHQEHGLMNRLSRAAKKAQRSLALAIGMHWVFQSMLYMDPTERRFKLGIDAALTTVGAILLNSWLPWPAALLIAFLIAHTLNFFFNGQLFALLKNYGFVKHTYLEFRRYAEALARRAEQEPAIRYIAVYGSLSRQAWTHTSDLDGRILRRPGLINGVRACWFLLLERTRALVHGFPLDMYVLDGELSVDGRLRKDERPTRLEVENGLETIRFEPLVQQPELFHQLTGLSVEEFERLYDAVVNNGGDERMQAKGRKVENESDSRYRLGLKDRLLLFFVWFELSLGLAAVAYLFGLHRSTAGRYVRNARQKLEQNKEIIDIREEHLTRARSTQTLQQAFEDHPELEQFLTSKVETEAVETDAPSSSGIITLEMREAIDQTSKVKQSLKPENRAAGFKQTLLLTGSNLFTLIFFLAAAYTFISVLGMNVSYQDVWLLDGIERPFISMAGAYLAALLFSRELRRDALLTAVMASLMFAIPAVKYAHIYASTIDAAVHFSLMRSLAASGFPESNYYEFTPGVHILVASFAQLTGLSVVTWAKIIPGILGGLIPLSAYMLSKRLQFNYLLAKSIVVLSALSLPIMFIPQGTSYAAIIIAPLLTFIILSVISRDRPADRPVFTVIALLLLTALVMWHSISSLLVPMVLAGSGVVAFVLSLFLRKKRWEVSWLRSISITFILFGILGVTLTLVYWYFYADALWIHFRDHVALFISVIKQERESGGNLVPQRAGTLNIPQLAVVFAFYHARDAIMLAFAGIAIGATLLRLRSRKIISRPIELAYLFTSIYLIFFAIIAAAFAARFATFGYQRLLIYVLIVSPLLSGFGLWLIILIMRRFLRFIPEHLILTGFVMIAFAISAIQIYPYQPLFPRYETNETDGTTPLLWYHQVNTDYQRYLLDFAYNRLPVEVNLYTDYIKYQQTRLFIDSAARERFRYGPWGNLTESYVLLHYPGAAGAYSEQAEFRSVEAIRYLHQMDRTSIIYDNGGGFILFVPEELMPLYTLGGER
jgi:thymidylate kinase